MHSLKLLIAAAAIALGATSAQAITFGVDIDRSSVRLTQTGSSFLCDLTDCGLTASLAAGLADTSFELTEVGDSSTFDFLTFETLGRDFGIQTFDITATIAFDPPGFAVTSGGSGGTLQFLGSIIAGVLNWNEVPAYVVLDNGSEVAVDFQGGIGFLLGSSVTTMAGVTLKSVSPVPLPASVLMLMLGLGGLTAMRGVRKKAGALAA